MKDNREGCSCGIIVKIFAIIGFITVVAGVAYAIYRLLTPKYIEDLEDDFDDYFEDDEYEEEVPEYVEKVAEKTAPAEKNEAAAEA